MLVRFLYLKAINNYLSHVEALMTSISSKLSSVVTQNDLRNKIKSYLSSSSFKWSSVDKVLLPRGKLTRIVKLSFDAAKIRIIPIPSKHFRRKIDFHLRYFLLFHNNLYLYVPRIKQQRGPHPCEPRMLQ